MLVESIPEAFITLSKISLNRSLRFLGIFRLRRIIEGERKREEIKNLWNTNVKGSTYLNPLFITDQFELQMRTTMKKSSQFLDLLNQAYPRNHCGEFQKLKILKGFRLNNKGSSPIPRWTRIYFPCFGPLT